MATLASWGNRGKHVHSGSRLLKMCYSKFDEMLGTSLALSLKARDEPRTCNSVCLFLFFSLSAKAQVLPPLSLNSIISPYVYWCVTFPQACAQDGLQHMQ